MGVRVMSIAFAFAVALLVGASMLSYRSAQRSVEDARRSRHTQEAIAQIREVLALLADAETGQRGFALTGDERFLEPYDRACAMLPGELRGLRSLIADNPRQERRLDQLEAVQGEKLRYVAETIEVRRRQGLEAVAHRVGLLEGKQLMDAARAVLADMEEEEQGHHTERDRRVEAEAAAQKRTLLGLPATGLAVLGLAFLALVAACFAHAGSSLSPAPASAADQATGLPGAPSMAGLVVALQSVVITYGGWQSALYFTEEDRDPRRNLPRSMIGGVLSVLVIYLLVNLALLSVLPVADLARSTLPAADAAKVIFGGRGAQIITLLSLVSLPPLVNAIMMIGTRILFAMGRDRLLWAAAGGVNERGAPVVATVVTTAVAAVLIGSGTFQTLVAVASFFLAVNYCVSCLALITLRQLEPSMERPFRAWGYPWSVGIVLAGAVAFLIGVLLGDTRTALIAIGLLAAGLVGKRWLSPAIT